MKNYVVEKILIKDQNLIEKLMRIGDNLFCYNKDFRPEKDYSEEEEPLCYICYREASAVINFPCLHTGLCKKCGFQAYLEKTICPMCRQDIDKLIAYEKVERHGRLNRGRCVYRQLKAKEIPDSVREKLVKHFYA